MNKILKSITYSVLSVMVVLSMTSLADAQRRSDRDIRDAVRSLNSGIEDFEMNLRYQMQSSSSNNADLSEATDRIRTLRDRIRVFEQNYDRRRENRDDVNAIAAAAQRVELFLRTNPQNRSIQDNWTQVRRQIDRLASNYGVVNSWDVEEEPQNVRDYPPATTGTISVGLSGTYELDAARSESVDDIIADTRLGNENREDLKEKLIAPQQIAIDIRGDRVTLATSMASPVTIIADGRDKTETSGGRTVRVRATLSGDTLIVSSVGGETDYNITFTSLSDGRGLKVSRRITTDYLRNTVFAESIYNKTDSVARLNDGTPITVSNDIGQDDRTGGGWSDSDQSTRASTGTQRNNTGVPRASVTAKPGNYIVPNGAMITGVLENEINTGVSQNNDRFRLTVQTPDEYRGAVIEGYISNVTRSGKVTGQASVTLNFETITLRNGRKYDFAAYVTDARTLSGTAVRVDNESTLKGESQTTNTAKRGGIGAGIGAIIGAIAGGAKGAAIGAVIGAGGGAGSVAVQGRDDIQLKVGSSITVISTSPLQRGTEDR